MNIGCRFYLPEEIFLKAKTLDYPRADSFKKTFPGLITQGVFSLYKSKFISKKFNLVDHEILEMVVEKVEIKTRPETEFSPRKIKIYQ